MLTDQFMQVAIVVLLLALVIAVIYAARRIGAIERHAASMERHAASLMIADPISALRRVTEHNERLLEAPEGIATLVQYAMSEAAVAATMQDITAFIAKLETEPTSPQEVTKEYLKSLNIPVVDKIKHMSRRAWNYLKDNSKEIGSKLFDKINSLVKGMLKLGGDD